jgi:AAA+ ATPase superfamily predicted ATPase
VPTYTFPNRDAFLGREAELDRLERWWEGAREGLPVLVHGRRRTGKSWLLRRFAHGKDAQILTCDTRAEGDQLAHLAGALEGSLGFRAQAGDVRTLLGVLLRQAARSPRLVIIDEYPLLAPVSGGAESLTAVAVEVARSQAGVRLALCGSQVADLEALVAEGAPLQGRVESLRLSPHRFAEARRFLASLVPADQVVRYAVAGGMPLYLTRVGRPWSLRTVLCEEVLNPLAPLFDEVRSVLARELGGTLALHFSLLAALALAPSLEWTDLVNRSGVEESTASRYVRLREDARIVEATNPALAPPAARRRRYRIADRFVRFWFRFVFPYQAELEAGLRPENHYDRTVAPALAGHVTDAFEEICRDWVRARFPEIAGAVAPWWGLARHDLRRRGLRSGEEIDVVGTRGSAVTVVGACHWQSRPMGGEVLAGLVEHGLPALRQVGAGVEGARIVLFSRGGFEADLVGTASRRGGVDLVDLEALLGGGEPG